MIKVIHGNLFDTKAPIIAHQVNCQGKMGTGVARQVKEKYPEVFKSYEFACAGDENLLGKCLLFDKEGNIPTQENTLEYPYIANLFAQENYGYDGKQYTDVRAFNMACIGLYTAASMLDIDTIAMPYMIGCVRGGASWREIYMILETIFKDIDIELWKLPETIKEEDLYVQRKKS